MKEFNGECRKIIEKMENIKVCMQKRYSAMMLSFDYGEKERNENIEEKVRKYIDRIKFSEKNLFSNSKQAKIYGKLI